MKGKRFLKFVVDGQMIKKTGDFDNIVTGSKGYLFAQFILSPEWHGCKIAASFFSGGKEYPAILDENGVCEIPEQALVKRHFAVSLTGISNDYRIVTHKVFVKQGD